MSLAKKKRVLLLSEGFGAGHTQAAYALSDSLRKLYPEIQTKVMELGAFLHPTLAPLIFNAYRKTVTSQPKLIGLFYRTQYHKSMNRLTELALHKICYSHTAEIINQLRPDTIVCTHPLPSAVVSRLKRMGLTTPLCTVITDYDAHGTWISGGVDQYLVSTSEVKKKLIAHGVAAEKVNITGIPVHPNFWKRNNKEEQKRELGLNALPAVLIMGGGWGLLNNEHMFRYIANNRDHLQLIFCLGNNLKGRARLLKDPLFHHPNIRVLGYTKEIDKLMDASDLLITKPGGMTCTEGLAKKIPMLFYSPIPGQEEENCHYFTQQGYGQQIQSEKTIDSWFQMLSLQYTDGYFLNNPFEISGHPYNPLECSRAVMQSLHGDFAAVNR